MQEDPSLQLAKHNLRATLLDERMAVSPERRRLLDQQICARLIGFLSEQPGDRVSAFWPFRGEPGLVPALEVLHEAGRRVCLPVLAESGMQFRSWHPDAGLMANRFGILEPQQGALVEPAELDWVLMPLVAFSPNGIRLGMGSGYYDRTFAFCRQLPAGAGPVLVGVAYSLQEVDSLPAQSWDVPLDAVITEQGVSTFRSLADRT